MTFQLLVLMVSSFQVTASLRSQRFSSHFMLLARMEHVFFLSLYKAEFSQRTGTSDFLFPCWIVDQRARLTNLAEAALRYDDLAGAKDLFENSYG